MLSAQNRMRSGSDFTVAVRRGRRAGRQSLVVHYLTPVDRADGVGGSVSESSSAPLVGFVVPKSVGNAVVRNRVERRLRHLMRDRVGVLPDGSRLVVRAQPASAGTPHLVADLDAALNGVLRVRPVRAGAAATSIPAPSQTPPGSAS